MTRYHLLLIPVLLTAAPARADEAADRLAAAARAVLEKTCARCHANGQAEGGFGFVLDVKQLVERKKGIAGDSPKSRLFKKMQSGEMPPEDEKPRPTADEVAALKAWIDAGAPAFPATPAAGERRPFLSEESVLAAVRDHLRGLPAPSGQPFQRYFTLAHLHNNPSVSEA